MIDNDEISKPGTTHLEEMTTTQVKEAVSKWLYVSDPQALDLVLTTAAAIYILGDPLWLLLVGPSGGGKTEPLMMFAKSEDVFTISKLTPNTLISGLKNVRQGEDLIFKLNDKLVVIKDLSPLLEMGRDDQASVLADFRDAYDGHISKAWGSGKPPVTWEGKFGLIAAAVTHTIDRRWKFFAELGERFIRVNLRTNPAEQITAALEVAQAGKEAEMREDLARAGTAFLKQCKRLASERLPEMSQADLSRIKAIAGVTATLRTPVVRDHRHLVDFLPQAEVGTRLSKQMFRVAQVSAMTNSREITNEDMELVSRVAVDSISTRRYAIITSIAQGCTSIEEVRISTKLPQSSLKEELENLEMLEVVSQVDNKWGLHRHFISPLIESGLGIEFTRNVPPDDRRTG